MLRCLIHLIRAVRFRPGILLAALFAAAIPAAQAVVVEKGSTGTSGLGVAGTNTAWTLQVAPGAGDVALWDSNSIIGTQTLNATTVWSGIQVTNIGGLVTLGAGTGGTLLLGTSGIDLTQATANFTISAPLTVNGTQTWNLASGSSPLETLGVSGGLVIGSSNTSATNLILSSGNVALSGTSSLAPNTNGTVTFKFTISGGCLTDTSAFTVNGQTAGVGGGVFQTGGTTNFNGGLTISEAAGTNGQFANYTVSGGTMTASSISIPRQSGSTASTTGGLTVSGGSVNVAGALTIGAVSYASATVNGGNLTVNSASVGNANRAGTLTVSSGNFTSNTSITLAANAAVATSMGGALVISGTGNVSTSGLIFGSTSASSNITATTTMSGGSLYIGSGGITKGNTTGTYTPIFTLGGGSAGPALLGADANFTSSPLISLTLSNATVQTADSTGAPFNITLSGVVGGTNLVQTGGGMLTLGNTSNSYTGNTTINGGTVAFATLAGLGSSSNLSTNLNINNGTLQYIGTTAVSTNRSFTLTGNTGTISANGTGNFSFSNTTALNYGTTNVPTTFTLTGNNTGSNTFAGNIPDNGASGPTSLVKNGTGAWFSTGTNTYTGPTTINAGTLTVNNLSASTNITVNAGGELAPTASLTVPTLTLGASGVGNATLDFYFSSTTSYDQVFTTANNGLTLNGGAFNFFTAGGNSSWAQPGTYDLIQYNGSIQGTFSSNLTGLIVSNPDSSARYSFSSNSTYLILTIAAAPGPNSWNVSSGGSWGTPSNWTTGVPASNVIAIFPGASISSPVTVTLDGDRTAAGLSFGGTNAYTIGQGSGGNLSLINDPSPANVTVTSGSHFITAPVILDGDGAQFNIAAGQSLSVSGGISESSPASVILAGAGTLALSGTNNYSGGTFLNAGILNFNGLPSLGTGTLTFNGGTLQWATGTSADISSLPLNFAGSSAILDTNGNNVTLAGTIGPSTGSLTKVGNGILTLLGTNSYSGGTNLLGGEVAFNSTANFGSGGITLNGGGLQWPTGVTLDISSIPLTFAGTSTLDTNGNNVTLASPIGNNGAGGLTKVGNGILTLTAVETYTGATNINGGSLNLGAAGAIQQTVNVNSGGTLNLTVANGLASTAAITVNSGGLFNVASLSDTVTSIAGAGNIALGAGTLTLTGSGSSTFSGNLDGSGTLTETSTTGTTILNGPSTFTGTINVTGGTLAIGSAGIFGASGAVNTVSVSTGTFQLNGGNLTATNLNNGTGSNTAGTITIGAGSTATFTNTNIGGGNNGGTDTINGGNVGLGAVVDPRSQSNDGAPSTSTGLIIAGGNVTATSVKISTNNSGGDLTIHGGNFTIGNSTSTGAFTLGSGSSTARGGFLTMTGGSLTYLGTDGLLLSTNTTNGTWGVANITGGTAMLTGVTLNSSNFANANSTLNVSGGNLYLGTVGLVVNTPSSIVGVNFGNGTIGALADWSTIAPITLNSTAGTTFQTADPSAVPHNITLNGVLSGSGALIETGGDVLTLNGTNTYAGTTTINSGTLQIGNGGTTGSIGTAAIVDNGTLVFNRSDVPYTVVNAISGTGAIAMNGTGTTVLAGANSYTGGTNLNTGTLSFNTTNLGSGGVTFNGGTLQWNGTTTDITAGNVVTFNAGGGTLDTHGNNVTFGTANITGGGVMTKVGNGKLTLGTGVTAPSGGVNVNGGSLEVVSGAQLNSGAVAVTGSNLSIDTTSTVAGAVTLNAGGNLTLGQAGTSSGTPITLDLGSNLMLGANSTLNFVLSSGSGNDTIDVANSLELNGGASTIGFNFYAANGSSFVGAGSYELLGYGSLTGSVTSFFAANAAGGTMYAFDTTTNPGFVTLTITTTAPLFFWQSGAGNWSNASNWTSPNAGIPPPNAAQQTAIFDAHGTGGTVTLDQAATVGSVQFNDSGASYTIASDGNPAHALTLDNGGNAALVTDQAGNHTLAVPVVLNSALAVSTTSAGDTLAISGNISDSGSHAVTVSGNGTVALSGVNTYGGGTIFNSGILNFTNGALSTGSLTFNGGTLQWATGNAQDISSGRVVTINSGGATLDTNGNNVTIGSAIGNGGAGSLTKAGAGTLDLTAANTFTGPMGLNGGTVQFAALNNLGAGSAINFNGGSLQWLGTVDISTRLVTFSAGGATLDTNGHDVTLANAIGNSGPGGLTKAGNGNLFLNAVATYTGPTAVNAGTLDLGVANAVPNSALTVGSGAVFNLANFNDTVASVTGAGNITVGTATLAISGNTATTFSGNLDGTGALTEQGANGTTTLSGVSTFAGALNVTNGTLAIASTGVFGTTLAPLSAVSAGSGGIFQLNGGNLTATTLNDGAGSNTAATVTIGANSTAAFGSTNIGGNNNGGSLTITGGNVGLGVVANLRDSSNNGTPSTTSGLIINGGNVTAASVSISTGNSGGDLNLTGGNLVIGNSTSTGAFTIGSGSSATRGGFLTMTGGSLTYLGTDGLLLATNATNGTWGVANITGGTAMLTGVTLNSGGNSTSNSTLTVAGGNLYLGSVGLVANAPSSLVSITLGNGTLGALADWSSAAPMTLNNSTVGTTFQTADPSANPHNITLSGALSGVGALNETGGDTLIFAGTNTYTGLTTISAGTLQIGNGGSAGTISGGSVVDNGSLVFNRSDAALSAANPISGNGTVTMNGTGTIKLSGFNTYTGGTTLNAGTVNFGQNSLGSGALNFNGGSLQWGTNNTVDISNETVNINSGGATLDTNGNNVTLANSIGNGGAGAVTKAGNGSLTFATGNNYSGGTTINTGTLILTNTTGSGTGSGAVQVNNGGTLTGTGSASGAVTLAAGAALTPGVGQAVGNLSTGTLTLSANAGPLTSTLNFYFGGGLNSEILDSGDLDINGGGVNLYQAGSVNPLLATGIYNLIQYGGNLNGNPTQLTVLNNPNLGLTYTFSDTGATNGDLVLTVGGTLVSGTWIAPGSGAWNTAGNWANGVIPNSVGQVVNFGPFVTGNTTVTVDGAETVGALIFNYANFNYTVAASTGNLTLDNSSNSAAAPITVTLGNETVSAPLILAHALGANVTVAAGYSLTLSGPISETPGAGAVLAFNGPGLQVLNGTNSFTGGVVLNGGTLNFNSQASFGTPGNLTLNAGTLQWATNSTTDISANGAVVGINGGVSFDTNGNNVTIANAIGNSGTGNLTKLGNGILTLQGNNTYSGGTAINHGTLNFNSLASLGTGATLTINAATLQWATGTTMDVSTDTLTIGPGGATLDLNGNNVTLANPIGNGGAGNLTEIGNATLTLGGNNTYAGATVVTKGTLSISADNNLGVAPGSATSNDLVFNGSTLITTASLTLNGNRSLSIGSGNATINTAGNGLTYGGVISGGALTKTGNGNLSLSGANTYTGGTIINGGAIELNNSAGVGTGTVTINNGTLGMNGALSVGNAMTVPLGANANLTVASNSNSSYNGLISGNGTLNLTQSGGGVFSAPTLGWFAGFSGNLNLTGTVRLQTAGDHSFNQTTLNLGSTGSLGTRDGGTNTIGTLIGLPGSNLGGGESGTPTSTWAIGDLNVDSAFGGGIGDTGGATSIIKQGTGTLSLYGVNSYSGTTTISSGTLSIGNGGSTGSIANGGITDTGTLAFNRSDNALSMANVISGAGTVATVGSGTVTLTGVSTYTGPTDLDAGTLSVATLPNGGTSGPIGASSGAASNLVFNGGSLQYTGMTATTNRSFTLGTNGGTLDASGTTIGSTGALTYGNTNPVSFSTGAGPATLFLTGNNTGANTLIAAIGDNGGNATSLEKDGPGLWVLPTTNTYTGTTTVNQGTLEATALGNSPVTINGGMLAGPSTLGGSVTVNNGGVLIGAVGTAGATTTIAGGLTVNSGGNFTGVGGATVLGTVTVTGGGNLSPSSAAFGNATAVVGNLTAGSLVANNGATLNFIFGNTSLYDEINVTNLEIDPTVSIGLLSTALTPLTFTGNYDLFNFTGIFTGSVNNLVVAEADQEEGLTYSFNEVGNSIILQVAGSGALNTWNGTGGGSWTNGTLWTNNAVPSPTATVSFFSSIQGNSTITLDANQQASGLQFGSFPSYTIAPGNGSWSLKLSNAADPANDSAQITVFSGNDSITAPVVLTGGGLSGNVASSSTLTISGVIGQTATAGLSNNGTGTLELDGLNTYTGVTTLNGGTLAVQTLANGGVPSGIGASSNATSNLVFNGGSLRYLGAGNSTDRLFTLGPSGGTIRSSGTGPLNFTNPGALALQASNMSTTLTLSGNNTGANTFAPIIVDNPLGNTTGLTKSGSGLWAVTGNGTQTGVTTISGGTLQISSIANGGVVQTALNLYGPSNLTITTDGSMTVGVNDASNLTTGQVVTAPNIPSGATITDVDYTNNLVTLTVAANSTSSGEAANFAGLAIANMTTDISGVTPGEVLVGPGLSTGTVVTSIDLVDNALILNQAPFQTNLNEVNLNTFTANPLGGSTNDPSNLIINGGTLQYVGPAGSTDRLFTVGSANATVDSSGTGALNFTNPGSLAFNGTASTVLTLTGNAAAVNTFAPIIGDPLAGNTSLVKSGTTTWALTAANTYTGGTTISGGTLQINSSSSLGTGNLSLGNGTLEYLTAFTSTRNIALTSANSTILVDDGQALTLNGNISGTGTLNFNGVGTLGGTNTYSGGTFLNGNVTLASVTGLGTGNTTLENGSTLIEPNATTAPALNANLIVAAGATANLTFSNNGSTSFSGLLSGSNTSVLNFSTIASTMTLNGPTNQFANFTGTLNVVQLGTSGLRLTTSGTYTSFANMTLNLATNGTLFEHNTGQTVIIGNLTGIAGSQLNGDNSGTAGNTTWQIGGLNANSTYAGNITDNGTTNHSILNKVGTGILTLTGNNTFAGNATFTGGEVNFGSLTNLGTGILNFNGGGLQWATSTNTDISTRTVNFSAGAAVLDTNGNDVTLANAIGNGGAGGLTKIGNGNLFLNHAESYTGNTTINGGNIVLDVPGVLPTTSNVSVASGAILNVNGQNATIGSLSGAGNVSLGSGALTTGGNNLSPTFGGSISGVADGGLVKNGTGTLTLSGTSTYVGPTLISAGNLDLTGSLSSSPVTVNSGAILQSGNGTISNSLTLNQGGKLSLAGPTVNTLTVGNFTWNATSTTPGLQFSLLDPTTTDTLNVLGNFTRGSSAGVGQYVFDFDNTGFFGGVYTLIDFGSIDPGFTVSDFSYVNLFSTENGSFSINANSLTFNISSVPEPATWTLLLGAGSLLAVWRKRRQRVR